MPAIAKIARRALIAGSGLFFVILLAYYFPRERGVAVAIIHNCGGFLEVRDGGAQSWWFQDELERKFNIKAVSCGNATDPDVFSYADGYNAVSKWFAHKRFGHDVFAECEAEALRREKEHHDKISR